MKGTLHKTEHGWAVRYSDMKFMPLLPLHYDSLGKRDFGVFIEGKVVDFELVKEYIDDNTNQVQSYAKLIKPSTGSNLDLAKLEQKLDDTLLKESDEDLAIWLRNKRHQSITTALAVDFAKWISGKYTFGNILGKWYLHENTNKQYTEEELFELYKQTKL